MRKNHALVVALLLLCAPIAAAQVVLYIPASAHTDGIGGSQWRSDAAFKATGAPDANFTIELLQSNQGNLSPEIHSFTLAAGSCTRIDDLLHELFNYSGTAALRITITQGDLIVTSRTYDDDPGGTFGQYIPAYPSDEAFTFGNQAEIIQLVEDASYRSNLGFVNASFNNITVEVDLYSAPDNYIGTLDYTLAPYEHRQITQIFEDVTSSAVHDGFAVLRTTTTGARFFAYASVVDDGSDDAIFIPAMKGIAGQGGPPGASVIADHEAATAFDNIPMSAINQAMADFGEIFYGHTSHGSQIVTGLSMVEGEYPTHVVPNFTEPGGDLGHNGDLAWATTTRNALDSYPDYSMVVWSWCGGVSDNDQAGIDAYLNEMAALEAEYPEIVFVYMTGHLDGSGPDGNLYNRNDQIRDYCQANEKVLFDFADIESYDPDGVYYPWETDWCDWCTSWCDTHDCPECDNCAHSQCMNCFQKGKAFWWMLARLSGWGGR